MLHLVFKAISQSWRQLSLTVYAQNGSIKTWNKWHAHTMMQDLKREQDTPPITYHFLCTRCIVLLQTYSICYVYVHLCTTTARMRYVCLFCFTEWFENYTKKTSETVVNRSIVVFFLRFDANRVCRCLGYLCWLLQFSLAWHPKSHICNLWKSRVFAAIC